MNQFKIKAKRLKATTITIIKLEGDNYMGSNREKSNIAIIVFVKKIAFWVHQYYFRQLPLKLFYRNIVKF